MSWKVDVAECMINIIFIILFLFGLILPRMFKKIYLCIILLLLGLLSYNIIPDTTSDLYRHLMFYDETVKYGFDYVFRSHYMKSVPIYALFIAALSFFKNEKIVPLIVYLLTYIPLIMCIYKKCEKQNKKYFAYILTMFILFCISFNGAISGVRNMCSFSLFVVILYLELEKTIPQLIAFLLYIVLGFFHNSIFILIIIRFLIEFPTKKIISILLVTWPIALAFLSPIISLLSKIMPVFGILSDSFISYTSSNHYSSLGVMIFRALILLISIMILGDDKIRHKRNKFVKFYYYVFLFTISSIIQYDVFVRFCQLLVMMFPFVFLEVVEERKIVKKSIYKKKELIYLSVIMLTMFLSVCFLIWSEYTKLNFFV